MDGATGRHLAPPVEEQARRARRRVLDAAAGLFRARGYRATSLRAVAATAGVDLAEVELGFATKARLLKAVIDMAIAGDDEPVPMLRREWAARAQKAADAEEFVAGFGRQLVESAQRAAGLLVVLADAARDDPEVGAIATELAVRGEIIAGWLVDGLIQRGRLRDGLSRTTAINTVWALMDPTLFDRLTQGRGWTAERFERSFAESIAQLLLAPPTQRPTPPTTPASTQLEPEADPGQAVRPKGRLEHGQLCELHLPTADVRRSARFYAAVFGWRTDLSAGTFSAPGLRGQWLERATPAVPSTLPRCWIHVANFQEALLAVIANGGEVAAPPRLDDDLRWRATIHDPTGNVIGVTTSPPPAV